MGKDGRDHGGSRHKSHHDKPRSKGHRSRREDDEVEEGEIPFEEQQGHRHRSERHEHHSSGSRSSRRPEEYPTDSTQRNPISPIVGYSQPGGVSPEAASYFVQQPHHSDGLQDVSMGGTISAMATQSGGYAPYPPEEPFYSGPPLSAIQNPGSYTGQISYSPQPTPGVPVPGQQQYPRRDDGQPRQSSQSSYDAMSYSSSRQGTQGSVRSAPSPEAHYSNPAAPGARHTATSHPMARSTSQTVYMTDAGQTAVPAGGAGAAPGGYPAGYYSTTEQNWQHPTHFAAGTGDPSRYPGVAGYEEASAPSAHSVAAMGGGPSHPGADSRYQDYQADSRYQSGYTTSGTTGQPMNQQAMPPPDYPPQAPSSRRRASMSHYDREGGTNYGQRPGDSRTDYNEGYPAPRRSSTYSSSSRGGPRDEYQSSRHASSSSTETVRDRDRERYRNMDQHGDRRDYGSTDHYDQHGEGYQPGRARGSHSSRSIQNVDSAFGSSGDRRYRDEGRSYPAGIPEDWEGDDGRGSHRRGGGHEREYDYEDHSGHRGSSRRSRHQPR